MLTDYKNEGKWLTGRAALQLSHGGAGANTRAAKSFLTIGNPQGGLCRARHKLPYDEINVMTS